MIDRWMIKPNPAPKDSNRCSLLLKTDMKDLQKVLRKVGSKAGRPSKADAPFNQELVIKEADKKYWEELKEFLRQISKPDAELTGGFQAVSGAAPGPAVEAPPAPLVEAPAAFPAPVVAPAPALAPVMAPPPAPLVEAPAAFPAPVVAPTPALAPVMAPLPAPVAPPPPPAPVVAPIPAAEEEGPTQLIPAQPPEFIIITQPRSDFESYIVGPYNRFAHAACMSVVENPGSMYNPLVVSGEPGTGKSHMLNGMALLMAKKNKVILTDGVRLTEKANLGTLADALKDCNVLLIDDVHLLATVEVKSGSISAVLRDFVDKSKQVVLGSLFPPRMMGAVEDILGFEMGRGSAVELKVAPPPARKTIFNETAKRGSVRLGDEEWERVSSLPQVEMLSIIEDLRRLKTFKPDVDQKKLLPLLLAAGNPPDPDAIAGASSFKPLVTAPAIIPLALVGPEGAENELMYALMRVCEMAKMADIPIGFKVTLKKAYDTGQTAGLPAALAKDCRAAGAGAALVLGPAPGSPLAAREREFSHLLLHTLSSNAICTGWFAFGSIGSPGAALRALLNLQE